MDWALILKVLGPIVIAIAIFVEVYKLKIRKDKFKPVEIWILAAILSGGMTAVGYFSFELPGSYLGIIYYSMIVYALQFVINMKIIKAVTKEYAKSKGFKLEGFDWNE